MSMFMILSSSISLLNSIISTTARTTSPSGAANRLNHRCYRWCGVPIPGNPPKHTRTSIDGHGDEGMLLHAKAQHIHRQLYLESHLSAQHAPRPPSTQHRRGRRSKSSRSCRRECSCQCSRSSLLSFPF
jgi:hypothetical protein